MNLVDKENQCELCDLAASYRPRLNRILCAKHSNEIEAERAVRLYTARNFENIALEVFHQYQLTLSKKKMISIMEATLEKAIRELKED